jgi:hypothetical protein
LFDADEILIGTSPDNADTDGDGYTDLAELELGGNPLVYDAHLPDYVAPTILSTSIEDVFVSAATVEFTTSEPADALVEVGTSPGNYTMSFSDPALVAKHAIVLSGLPPIKPPYKNLFARITTKDRNGNATRSSELEFRPLPPHLHIYDMTLRKNGNGPFTLTVTVTVRDRSGQPVANVPVQGFWDGDIGGNPLMTPIRTDSSGVATYTTQPFTPSAPTTVTFSPLYVGNTDYPPDDYYFVGLGAPDPYQTIKFFYEQPANVINYRSVNVP